MSPAAGVYNEGFALQMRTNFSPFNTDEAMLVIAANDVQLTGVVRRGGWRLAAAWPRGGILIKECSQI